MVKNGVLNPEMLEISPRIEFLISSLPIFNPHESLVLPLCRQDTSVQRDILFAKEFIWEIVKDEIFCDLKWSKSLKGYDFTEFESFNRRNVSSKHKLTTTTGLTDTGTSPNLASILKMSSYSNSAFNFSKSNPHNSSFLHKSEGPRTLNRVHEERRSSPKVCSFQVKDKSSNMLDRTNMTQKKPDQIPTNPVVGPIMVKPNGYTKAGFKKPNYSYIGQYNLQNGCFEGYGVLRTGMSTHYEGEFKHSKLNGLGRKIDSNLNIYRGTFKNSTKHGFGILDRILDKTRFEGMFHKGVEHGYGREFVYKKKKLLNQGLGLKSGSFKVS